VKVVKSKFNNVFVRECKMQQRWGECFEDLLYQKNLGEREEMFVLRR